MDLTFTALPGRTVCRALVLAGLAALLLGCKPEPKTAAVQVVARVNGDEITVHQLEFVLSDPATRLDRQQALDQLVDQQLLVQAAREARLDRDPRVMLAIDQARRQILAQAQVDRLLAGAAGPQQTERDYYDQHPELFADRRLYQLRMFVVPAGALDTPLKQALDEARTPQQVRAALLRRQVVFEDSEVERAAEQLPPEVLTRLTGMQRGDVLLLGQGDDRHLYQLIGTSPAPVSFAAARDGIRQYLHDTQRERRLADGLSTLRKDARIDYLNPSDESDAAPSAPAARPLPSTARFETSLHALTSPGAPLPFRRASAVSGDRAEDMRTSAVGLSN